MKEITTSLRILKNLDITVPSKAEKTIQVQRQKCLSAKSLFTKTHHYTRLDDIDNKLADGRFSIDIDKAHFECIFHYKPGKNLYVIYDGARGNRLPGFPRWSYSPLFDGSYLGIEDPMYYDYDNLQIGFYYGSKQRSYIIDSLKIIKKVCDRCKVRYENIIFFSSSGGGYASLYASTLIENSLSISINPQLYIQNYGYANTFTQITNMQLDQEDALLRNDLVRQIKKSKKSKHIIICNIQDHHHFMEHIVPFCEKLSIPLKYGISIKDNILLWLYDADGTPSAHTSFETKTIFSIIDYIAKCFQADIENIDSIYNIVTIANCFWYELYSLKKKVSVEQKALVLGENISIQEQSFLSEILNINMKSTSSNYNYFRINITAHTINNIKILAHTIASSSPKISICIYDFNTNYTKYHKEYATNKDINLNFIMLDSDSFAVCIYAGLRGATQGHYLQLECKHLWKNIEAV